VGSWLRQGETENITLVRPEPTAIVKANAFVGEWIGEHGSIPTIPFEPTTLSIRQSPDGIVSVSMDWTSTWIDARTWGSSK
jgi:hypothetical protein